MPLRSLRSIVAGRPPVEAASITTVVDAARIMKRANIGALLVVDHARLIGIFTERDALFRLLAEGRDPHATRLADVMTPRPQTIHPDEPFLRALRMMHEGKFRHLPVVEFDRPLGVVSRAARRPRAARDDERVAPAITYPRGDAMAAHTYKLIELVGTSPTSTDEAIRNAIEKAAATVKHIDWYQVIESRGHVENGRVSHYQVALKVGFRIED